jgi:hypothetical protein
VYIDSSSTDYDASSSLDEYIQKINSVDYFYLTLNVEQRRADIAPLGVSVQWQLVIFCLKIGNQTIKYWNKSIVGRNHANLAPIYLISDAFFRRIFFLLHIDYDAAQLVLMI